MRRATPIFSERCAAGVFFLLVLMLVTAGCADSVNPFIDSDRFFTIYGYLDTGSDTQIVRVIPVVKTIRGSGEVIDARVTTETVETAEIIEWNDSLVTFNDGSRGHIFYASFRPIPGFTYRLNVERSDGRGSSAETTVPLAENASVLNPNAIGNPVTQRVRWDDVDFPPFRVEVWYRLAHPDPRRPFIDAVVTYNEVGKKEEDTWEVVVELSRDKARVADLLDISENASPVLLAIGMRLAITDDQWRPPGGVFDRELLVQPGTFSNVENGFGFLGAVNQYTVEWTLDAATTRRLGYSLPN